MDVRGARQPEPPGKVTGLRILHVANFSIRAKGAFVHNVDRKLTQGLIRNGHQVIGFCERDVPRQFGLGHRKIGARLASKALLEMVRDVQPDFILLGHASAIGAATVRRLREAVPDVRIAHWNVDPLYQSDNVRRINELAEVVDAIFVTTAGAELKALARPGTSFGYLPNPCDDSVERGRSFERSDLPVDLFYASGNAADRRFHAGKYVTSGDLLCAIEEKCAGINCAFVGVNSPAPLLGGAYQHMLESARMGLNISQRNDFYLCTSDRLAHIMGNGLLAFIDEATGFRDVFDDDCLVFYRSEDELLDKIEFFHGNDQERRRIAARGWARYHELFNERNIAAYIVDAAYGAFDPASVRWPSIV